MPAKADSRLVILVEDPIICNYLRYLLKPRGYQLVEAAPQHGVDLVRTEAASVALVITNTPALFLAFAQQVPVLYLAAAPDQDLAARFRACRTLRKPFHPRQFLEAVEDLTASL